MFYHVFFDNFFTQIIAFGLKCNFLSTPKSLSYLINRTEFDVLLFRSKETQHSIVFDSSSVESGSRWLNNRGCNANKSHRKRDYQVGENGQEIQTIVDLDNSKIKLHFFKSFEMRNESSQMIN